MPAADVFLDANVLVYALSDAPAERGKRDQSAQLIATLDFGTSYQVVMETWVVATRKMTRLVSPDKVAAFLERILAFPCIFGTPGLYRQAAVVAQRYRIHPYDAAVIAAAQELGAARVLSEDLSHGQVYAGVTVINPFAAIASN